MQKKHYDEIAKMMRERERIAQGVVLLNRALTVIGYIAFPLLIVMQVCVGEWQVALKTAIVCGIGFCAVAVLRCVINAPRPYEVLGIKPLVKKGTLGKSFPSRHAFCMFMIAFAWCVWNMRVGAVLVVLSCVMGVVRVVLGVHWPRDILGAIVCAGVFGVALVLVV